MRALYAKRRDALLKGLGDLGLPPHNTDAGLHLTVFLPKSVDDRAVVREAARRGIYPTALSTCYAGPRPKRGLVLGFGGASERRIAAACRVLGRCCARAAMIAVHRSRGSRNHSDSRCSVT